MKGLLTKDFLTIKKKYGLPRVIMDIAIIIALMFILEKSGTIYISFLLIPIEIMSMIISLTTCDEQWKWGKYAVSLPVSKKQIVCSRYACAGILSLIGFVVALIVNSASYILFPQYSFCNREIGCRCFGGVSRRTAKKTVGCFLLYHSGGALPEAMVQCPLQGRNTQSTNRRFVRGVYFALKRRGLGEWLFYFADIVFIQQVSSLIDAHKSL